MLRSDKQAAIRRKKSERGYDMAAVSTGIQE